MHHRPFAFVAVATALLATACGGSSNDGGNDAKAVRDGAGRIVVTAGDDFRFSPDTIEVPRGVPVVIELHAEGGYPHNLAIPDRHVTSDTVGGALAPTVTTVRATFTEPGTYRFLCTFHSDAGMTGRVVVR